MGDERITKICLEQEIRNLKTVSPSNSSKKVKIAFNETEYGEILGLIWEAVREKEVAKNLERNIEIKIEHELTKNGGV